MILRWTIAGVLALAVQATAQTSTTTVKGEGKSSISVPKSKKKFGEIEGITDPEVRAEAGSRSRYSIKGTLSYSGAPVGEPLSENLPNPDDSPGTFKTSLSGTISARYRLDKNSSLGLGTGIKTIAPFHGAERTDLTDPRLSYTSVYKAYGIQSVTSASVLAVTNPDYTEIGEVAGLTFYQSGKYRVGSWTYGLSLSFSNYYYDRAYESSDGNAANYFLSLSPSLSYRVSDKVKIKTSVKRGIRNLRKAHDLGAWDNRTVSGKLGVGIGITKDIYINPYLYYYPEEFSWKSTSLSFSTVFSIL